MLVTTGKQGVGVTMLGSFLETRQAQATVEAAGCGLLDADMHTGKARATSFELSWHIVLPL
jgi:hypothetical protein